MGDGLSNMLFYVEIRPIVSQIFTVIVLSFAEQSESCAMITICQICHVYMTTWNRAVYFWRSSREPGRKNHTYGEQLSTINTTLFSVDERNISEQVAVIPTVLPRRPVGGLLLG